MKTSFHVKINVSRTARITLQFLILEWNKKLKKKKNKISKNEIKSITMFIFKVVKIQLGKPLLHTI